MMPVTARSLTLIECRNTHFERYVTRPFWDALDYELLEAKKIDHAVVLDIVGTLAGGEPQEFHARIQRLVENGERPIVVNLEALATEDSATLGAIVRSSVSVQRNGGMMPLVNAPRHFRLLVGSMKFL